LNLIYAPDHLPRPRKDRSPLQIHDPRIHIPRGGNRRSLGQWRVRIVALDNLFYGIVHVL
jgi:hypothetical protein